VRWRGGRGGWRYGWKVKVMRQPGFSKGVYTLVKSLVPAEKTEGVTVKKGGRSS
jgi:hypothetical protein